MELFDVIILGAGGSGMMCAIEAGQRGRSVLILDHSRKIGGKILISGGGRCNFTNIGATSAQYVSKNPHFCKSALSRFPSRSFVAKVEAHGVPYHERKHGQLFCDDSARDIVDLLKSECDHAGVRFELGCTILEVSRISEGKDATARFRVTTNAGEFRSESLVVATGGLSIPKIGATDLGFRIARQFGLQMVDTAPGLDGLTFGPEDTKFFSELSGASIECLITCNGVSFREALLFTHTGLSGPAALQASLHWHRGDPVTIDLLPEVDVFGFFLGKKKEGSRSRVRNLLCELLPSRFAERFCELHFPSSLPLPQVSEKALQAFCELLRAWKLRPTGTVGYGKAEVTRGGVDTDELSSKTMEVKKIPGLYFIGEVVDVTGWLGGYNFQWAWSSGWAAGQSA